ncbi:MAG: hypothetical protein HYZ38_01575 [Mycobacterium sp.]|nr:hypothetical protein [Mycobacterium sp.]
MPAEPFLGAEALAAGRLNRHQLRTRFGIVFPGVYLDRSVGPALGSRITAAWLWSRRRAVVGGLAASALHGAKWVPADATIELISDNTHPPAGIRCHDDTLGDGETCLVRGIPVTTPERTAFDIARRGALDAAIARLDALMNATGVKLADIEELAARHRHTRGLRQLETVLLLADAGAQSPRETALRLLLIRAGLTGLQTQIEVFDGDGEFVARVDMGWRELLIAVEYDGEQHRTDRRQYIRDVRRLEALDRLGWVVIRVVKEDRPADIIRRVRDAQAESWALRRKPGRKFG